MHFGQFQAIHCSFNACFKGLVSLRLIFRRRGRTGQMIDKIYLREKLFLANIGFFKNEIWIRLVFFNIFQTSCLTIIQANNYVILF